MAKINRREIVISHNSNEYCGLACDGLEDTDCNIFGEKLTEGTYDYGYLRCQKCLEYTAKIDRENENANN